MSPKQIMERDPFNDADWPEDDSPPEECEDCGSTVGVNEDGLCIACDAELMDGLLFDRDFGDS